MSTLLEAQVQAQAGKKSNPRFSKVNLVEKKNLKKNDQSGEGDVKRVTINDAISIHVIKPRKIDRVSL